MQFPEALLKHPKRWWVINIKPGELFSIRLQHKIKAHPVHAAAALATSDVLGYGNHAVNGVLLVVHTLQCMPNKIFDHIWTVEEPLHATLSNSN